EPRLLELADPALVDFLERDRIEEMELLAAAPLHGDEVRCFEHGEVLRHALARHVEGLAELTQRCAVVCMQAMRELSAPWIGQRLEQEIRVAHRETICKRTLACQGRQRRSLIEASGVGEHTGISGPRVLNPPA